MMDARQYAATVPMHWQYQEWLAEELDQYPRYITQGLITRHEATTAEAKAAGQATPHRYANIEVIEYAERHKGRLPPDASNERLESYAQSRARECSEWMRKTGGDVLDNSAAGRAFCQSFDIEPPDPRKDIEANTAAAACVNRMADESWWRRKIWTKHGRRIEQSARELGLVRRGASPYISQDSFNRIAERATRNEKILEDMLATSDYGDEMSLAEVAALGTSNPEVRRCELMTRISGMEETAERCGHAALFVTVTTPREYHAVRDRDAKLLPGRYKTPQAGQAWLNNFWQKTRSAFARQGIADAYGLRSAEPHCDGTPHWHMLIFVAPEQAASVKATLRRYALDGDTSEARREHACKIEVIDRERGSATSYIAKYISKAIDGYRVGEQTALDDEGKQSALRLDPAEAARRIRAWASLWGIRQFQSFGTPPVGPWRELRRLDEIKDNPSAERLRQTADAADWSGYMRLMGESGSKAKNRPARVEYQEDIGVGRYGEPKKRASLLAYGQHFETRPKTWTITYRNRARDPWEIEERQRPRDTSLGFIVAPTINNPRQRARQDAIFIATDADGYSRISAMVTAAGENATEVPAGTVLPWIKAKKLPPSNAGVPNSAVWRVEGAIDGRTNWNPEWASFGRAAAAQNGAAASTWTRTRVNNCTQRESPAVRQGSIAQPQAPP